MKGFTLIEMMVSVAIFSFVMVIALGALLAISTSDRKAESLKAVINNLNFSLDSMSRAIRTGSSYGCGLGPGVDCPGGAIQIAFNPSNGGSRVAYRLESLATDPSNAASTCNQISPNIGCIVKTTDSGVTWLPITAPEVVIQDCSVSTNLGCTVASYPFYTVGTAVGTAPILDKVQPKVVITLSGYVNLNGGATSQASCGTAGAQCSVFHVETSVTQRIYDQ